MENVFLTGGMIGTKLNFEYATNKGIWALGSTTQFPKINLYPFTNFTFTNAGAAGVSGPTLAQCKSAYNSTLYAWLDNIAFFNVTNGIQLWTVPRTGTYTIDAYGAGGGVGGSTSLAAGGAGARVAGNFFLTAGQKLRILVGQTGIAINQYGAGGGGGTFIVKETGSTTADILVIAGGGGGAGYSTNPIGVAASITNNGTAAADGTGTGGTAGNGGPALTASYSGGGGGGFIGNGATGGGTSPGGLAFTSGGTGGTGAQTSYKGNGGFGGGGSASVNGGGGGGYSGGAAGSGNYPGGGGGGSYNNGTSQINTAGARASATNGQVIITFLG